MIVKAFEACHEEFRAVASAFRDNKGVTAI